MFSSQNQMYIQNLNFDRSAAVCHHGELPGVTGVPGVVLRVLHPPGRLHREQGVHQHQHAALRRCLGGVGPAPDPGEREPSIGHAYHEHVGLFTIFNNVNNVFLII